ncbi:MAG TPA: DegT/DnrJ/EryC1/StrS family aminotransferase [Streptosporangiaceae bacterium]|nr:DegT/DnrJ/EryC1/StrS family aminotransferase [Streptosporangiaceae bacterium]
MAVAPARVVFPPADRAEIAAAVSEVLASGMLTLGAYTRQFEAAFAAAHSQPDSGPDDVPHAVAVSSGTAALEIALRYVGVRGRDVIVPANTFYATAASVVAAGGRPVFADMDPDTFALSPQTLAAALTPQTAAVVIVHVGGLISPDIDEVRRMCATRGIALVEDAAHAHGSTWNGQFAGSFGTAAAFSFYPTKVVTCGEGGLVLTSSGECAEEARIYRDQGKGSFTTNHHVLSGYAWRMSELSAVTGLVHLRRMGAAITRRREVAARYTAALAGLDGLTVLPEPAGCESNFYKYIVVLPPGCDRAQFKKELADVHQVRLAGEVYDVPLHQQPVLAEFAGASLPVAEDLCARHVCLPVHSDMTDDEVDEVLTAVSAVYGATARV